MTNANRSFAALAAIVICATLWLPTLAAPAQAAVPQTVLELA